MYTVENSRQKWVYSENCLSCSCYRPPPQFFHMGTIVKGLLYFLQRDSRQIHTHKAYDTHHFAHCFPPPTQPYDVGNHAILVCIELPC